MHDGFDGVPMVSMASMAAMTIMAAKHATKPSNINDTANFPTNRFMGRLWYVHFMDLGYPSKFYEVQDAILIDGSSI